MLEFYNTDFSRSDNPALYWADNDSVAQMLRHSAYTEQSTEVCTQLAAKGIRQGDRVAVVASATPSMAIVLLACARSGIVAMPLSPRFPSGTIAELLHRTNSRILLYDDTTQEASIDAAFGANILLCHLDDVVSLSNAHTSSSAPLMSSAIRGTRHLFQDALHHDATILCTSGSTGAPKAIVHTLGNHYFSALGAAENIPFGRSDCWLASLPLYHVGGYGIFFRALVGGASVAFPDYQSFDVERFIQTLDRFPVTHCSFVATQLFHLLRNEAAVRRLQQLRAIVLGGGAIPQRLIQTSLERGLPIYTSYGCTEMASQITTSASFAPEDVQTSGNLLKFRELSLAADGEILVRGATLAKGRLSGKGIETMTDENAWFHTKDIGECDAQGRLKVVGRKDNMFISGGENIHPEAIEQALSEHPSVVQAIVVPVPNDQYGARPVAFVHVSDAEELSKDREQELRSLVENNLPRFAVPDTFWAFPPDALSVGIKPSRVALQRLAEGLTS